MRILTNELGNIQSSLSYFLKFNIPKNAKILDIGCNFGSLIFNLHEMGYENVYGIDINKESINLGKKEYNKLQDKLILYDGKIIPFKDKSFDVVLMFDVIEHIPQIKSFLKNEVYRTMKNGGLLIFQTPNVLINIPWEIINTKSLIKWRTYHCSLQTLTSLKKLLNQIGYKKIRIEKYYIDTSHNSKKLKRKLGFIGPIFLKILSKFPLWIYPNFFGSCLK